MHSSIGVEMKPWEWNKTLKSQHQTYAKHEMNSYTNLHLVVTYYGWWDCKFPEYSSPYQSSPLSGPCTRKRKPLRDLAFLASSKPLPVLARSTSYYFFSVGLGGVITLLDGWNSVMD